MSSTGRPAARLALVLVAALGLLTAAQPWPTLATGATIRIVDSVDPSEVTVAPGTTITWVNESGNRHRVRTTSAPAEFDSGNLEPGQQFSVTLTAVGTYDYVDDRNKDDASYWARIIVAAQDPTPTAPADPGAVTPPPPAPSAADVGMAGEVFRPTTITIAPGGSATWHNDDDRAHTVSATSNAFDSGTLSPGQTYTRTFASAGTYSYLCLIHPKMTGTVVVAAPGTTPPPAPATAPTPTPVSTPMTSPAPHSVRAVDFAFQPTSLIVAAGSRVTFVNAGRAPHTMTARDGSFDSGFIEAGGSWSTTFRQRGTFAIWCVIHPDMTGSIEVTESGSGGEAVAVHPSASATSPAAANPSASAAAIAAVGGSDPAGRVTVDNGSGDATVVVNAAGQTGVRSLPGAALSLVLVGGAAVLFMRAINGVIRRAQVDGAGHST